MKAVWNNQLIAQSDETIVVEGNHYFPAESIDASFFKTSTHSSYCFWKGTASYYNIVVGDQLNENAAWYYPTPKSKAEKIKGYVAFWKGVVVSE